MARPVLDAMDMDTLTKGRYVQLLARSYSPKDVFKALSKGTDMEKERLRKEFDYWSVCDHRLFYFYQNKEGRKTHEL